MSKVIPCSYSSLTSFETCPRKHYEEKIAKSVARVHSQAAEDGSLLHKMAEDFINENKPFEHQYKPQIIETVAELRVSSQAPLFAEVKIAVTRDLSPTLWDAQDCYARAIIDLYQPDKYTGSAYVGDWKTGRSDPFSTQLKFSALMVMSHEQMVKKVNTQYIWLKEKTKTKATIHRDFLEQDWKKFVNRIDKLEKAHEENKWVEKPSGLCKKYCSVGTCQYNGNFTK